MKKLNLVMCFFGLLGTFAFTGCNSSDKQKVINHLITFGTDYLNGTSYDVSTGSDTELRYIPLTDYFLTSCSAKYEDASAFLWTSCKFGSDRASVDLNYYYGSTTRFKATWSITFSNHKVDNMVDDSLKILVCELTNYNAIISLMVAMSIEAVDNASTYLSNNGLPYIYQFKLKISYYV